MDAEIGRNSTRFLWVPIALEAMSNLMPELVHICFVRKVNGALSLAPFVPERACVYPVWESSKPSPSTLLITGLPHPFVCNVDGVEFDNRGVVHLFMKIKYLVRIIIERMKHG